MSSVAYYERRRGSRKIKFDDRRLGERRNIRKGFLRDNRRNASQIRRNQRKDLFIPATVYIQEKELRGQTQDISPEGVYIKLGTRLKVGTPISLKFIFGNDICYLNISGQVTYCNSQNGYETPQYGIGIKFAGIKDWEQKVLESAVSELIKRGTTVDNNSLLSITVSKDTMAMEAARYNIAVSRPLDETSDFPRRSCIHASKIVGWGSYLPPNEITNQDISDKVTTDGYKNVGEVVENLTGIKTRRYENPHLFPSDLAARAAVEALNAAKMDPADLDVIIFFGISRDFDEPATANVVQEKIGAKNAYVFDMANACNGFVTAVDTLDSMIASGRCENGIVVTGELVSPYIDWSPKTRKDLKLSVFGYTIGDAGGAAVLSRAHLGDERGIRARWFSSEGSYWRLALAGSLEGANENNKFFRAHGQALEEASIKFMPQGFREIRELLGWKMDDIDLVIPHQIPTSIVQNLYHKSLGIPYDKLYWTFPRFGNIATASMPVAVCDAIKEGKAKSNQKVVLIGGGAGFTTGILGLVL